MFYLMGIFKELTSNRYIELQDDKSCDDNNIIIEK